MPEQRSEHDLPAINISLQLDASLRPIFDATGQLHSTVLQSVEQRLSDLIRLLGVPGRVVLDIGPLPDTTHGDAEWMRLRANGTLCLYPKEILVFAWSSAAGRLAVEKPADIHGRLRAAADAQAENGAGQVAEFLGLVCTEIISRQPAVLLGPAHVDAYSARLEAFINEQQSSAGLPDTSWLMQILNRVLELRISITDTEAIAKVLADNGGAAWEDVVEALIDALAPDVVELHVPESYVAQLTTPDENESDLLALVRESMFRELGVIFPLFRLVPSTQREAKNFTLMINHVPTLPVLGLEADECLVNDTPERLRVMEIEGREAVNPATQQPATVVNMLKKEPLEAAGLTTWDQVGYCMLWVAETLRRNSACFVHRLSTEIQLGQLEQAFPALVEVSRARTSIEEITRVLRALSSEQVSIYNLRLILERLLDYQYRTSDLERYSILDDRLSLSGYLQVQRADDLVAFVRAGLKRQISDQYAQGKSALVVYLVDPELEHLVNAADTEGIPNEERQERVIAALADEMSNLPPTALRPSILTTIGVRASLREAIKLSFPSVGVLAYQELRPDLNIQPVARISSR